MQDEDVRLAARLARAAGLIHPLDWVAVYESHNEYEWKLQKLFAHFDKWGDDRADASRAANTARIVQNVGLGQLSSDDLKQMVKELCGYLAIHNPEKFLEENKETLDKISAAVQEQ